MPNAIKPSEISEVLLSQLRDATASSVSTDWTMPKPANCWTAATA